MVGFMGDGIKSTANVLQSCFDIVNQSVSVTFIKKRSRISLVKCAAIVSQFLSIFCHNCLHDIVE